MGPAASTWCLELGQQSHFWTVSRPIGVPADDSVVSIYDPQTSAPQGAPRIGHRAAGFCTWLARLLQVVKFSCVALGGDLDAVGIELFPVLYSAVGGLLNVEAVLSIRYATIATTAVASSP